MRGTRYDAEALALALRLGDRTFRRMVKKSFGVSPGAWLRRERAVAFRHQLMEGARIKQLSSYYGFKNPCDFSAEFKRWYQVSPSIFVAEARDRAKLDDD